MLRCRMQPVKRPAVLVQLEHSATILEALMSRSVFRVLRVHLQFISVHEILQSNSDLRRGLEFDCN